MCYIFAKVMSGGKGPRLKVEDFLLEFVPPKEEKKTAKELKVLFKQWLATFSGPKTFKKGKQNGHSN